MTGRMDFFVLVGGFKGMRIDEEVQYAMNKSSRRMEFYRTENIALNHSIKVTSSRLRNSGG